MYVSLNIELILIDYERLEHQENLGIFHFFLIFLEKMKFIALIKNIYSIS